MRYRLAFIDVDGTLVTSDRRLTDRTRSALLRARAAGMRISLATGRTFESARPYADAVGADAPLVLYNGARIQDPRDGEVLREWRLDPALARVALENVAGWDVHVSLFHDEAIYIPAWTERARASAEKDGVKFVPAGDLGKLCDRPPLKLMLIGDVTTMDRLEVHLRDGFASRGGETPAVVRTEPDYVELWNREASKGAAAAWVASGLGIPLGEAIAFGDSQNDLPLLASVGLGVAMGNAHPRLLAVAREVAPSNDEEGVAAVIERLLGESA